MLGPLHRFQGVVVVEAGAGEKSVAGVVHEMECPMQHSNQADAALDAMSLSQVTLAAIDTALNIDVSVDAKAPSVKPS